MSEKLFRFFLSDLKHVRLICQKCNNVAEVKVEDLATYFFNAKCPLCGNQFQTGAQGRNALVDLGNALSAVANIQGNVKLQLTVPEETTNP